MWKEDRYQMFNESATAVAGIVAGAIFTVGGVVNVQDKAHIKQAISMYEKQNPNLVKFNQMTLKMYHAKDDLIHKKGDKIEGKVKQKLWKNQDTLEMYYHGDNPYFSIHALDRLQYKVFINKAIPNIATDIWYYKCCWAVQTNHINQDMVHWATKIRTSDDKFVKKLVDKKHRNDKIKLIVKKKEV